MEFEEALTLKLAKLTDEYKSGGNTNLSVGYFLTLASKQSWGSKEKLGEIYNTRIIHQRSLLSV